MNQDPSVIYAAAATAAGPAPDGSGYPQWLGRVTMIASDLMGLSESYAAREARKAECDDKNRFFAVLKRAEVIVKGSGDKTVEKGHLGLEAHSSQNVGDDGLEWIETRLLSDPVGSEEFARAQALVGRKVVIYKEVVPIPGSQNKARQVIAIDAAEAFSVAAPTAASPTAPAATQPSGAAPAPQPTPPQTASAPQAQTAPAAAPPVPQPAAVPEDPAERAAAAQAVIQQTAPQPEPAAAPAGADLSGVATSTRQELEAAAAQYFGMDAEKVYEFITAQYGPVPDGKKLPARMWQSVWTKITESASTPA